MKKTCKLVNDKFSWVMYVDGEVITFNGKYAALYFAKHYERLGYIIKWDMDKWRRDDEN